MRRLMPVILLTVLSLGILGGVAGATDYCSCDYDYEQSSGGVWVPRGTTQPTGGGGGVGPIIVSGAKKATEAVDASSRWWTRTKFLSDVGVKVYAGYQAVINAVQKIPRIPFPKDFNMYNAWGGR